VAGRLDAWPLMRAAFWDGQVTYCQCRALTRLSPAEDEAAWLRVAQTCTVDELLQRVRLAPTT